MSDALRFDDVTFTYPEGSRPAIDSVDLVIDEGSFALAVGPTGSGKSTLLRAANGLVPQFTGGTFAGRVSVEGRDTLAHPPRRLADVVAFVPQDPGASFVLDRVEDELAYGMENLGVDPAHMRRRVEETLDLLDVTGLRDRSVRTLSGGERQRVAIASALAAGPRILVLDEPTSQLDPQGAEDVMAALQRLVHDHGMTVLLAEHRLERVAGWVDVAIGFDRGRVSSGSPADVIGRLAAGPPVTRLGRMLGWDPLPLTVRAARGAASAGPRPTLPPLAPTNTADGDGSVVAQVRGLRASYGETTVLRDLDLDVHAGEVLAVMGRNGAGKSTLLRALAGIHEPAGGQVRVLGGEPRPGIDVALCPQEADELLFKDSVEQEVRATLVARGEAGSAAPWLAAMGIAGLAARHPRDLSAGERLLVATAAVAATGAPLLALDEPTRGLDPASKERLIGFVRVPRDRGAGGDRRDARRRTRGRGRDARRDPRRGRRDRGRRPGIGPRRLPRLRPTDDARLRAGVADPGAGRGGARRDHPVGARTGDPSGSFIGGGGPRTTHGPRSRHADRAPGPRERDRAARLPLALRAPVGREPRGREPPGGRPVDRCGPRCDPAGAPVPRARPRWAGPEDRSAAGCAGRRDGRAPAPGLRRRLQRAVHRRAGGGQLPRSGVRVPARVRRDVRERDLRRRARALAAVRDGGRRVGRRRRGTAPARWIVADPDRVARRLRRS